VRAGQLRLGYRRILIESQFFRVKKEDEDEEADAFLVLSTDNWPFAVSPLINNCCEINPNWSKIDQKFN
jgi:hypothetical protein